jgi:nitroreductase
MDLVERRQSVRAYADKPVDRGLLDRCVETARLAPSACNSQPWTFVIVDEPNLKQSVAQHATSQVLGINAFAKQAPVLVVIVTEPSNFSAKFGAMIKNRKYHLIDLGIAVEHFCLRATEEGLGTCILGWFDEKPVKRLLKIPFWKRLHLIITVGYPVSDAIREKARKPLDEIRSFNTYH